MGKILKLFTTEKIRKHVLWKFTLVSVCVIFEFFLTHGHNIDSDLDKIFIEQFWWIEKIIYLIVLFVILSSFAFTYFSNLPKYTLFLKQTQFD